MKKFLDGFVYAGSKHTPDSLITLDISNGMMSMPELSTQEICVECNLKHDDDFKFYTSRRQLKNIIDFLKVLSEQPVSLTLDTDNNCIWIREAIL